MSAGGDIEQALTKAEIDFVVEGDPSLPALVCAPDVGINTEQAFRALFNYDPNRHIFSRFCIYHVVFPGQVAHAEDLRPGEFPSFDEILDQLYTHLNRLGVKTFIGLGVGAGGTILLNYGLKFQNHMRGLVMISADPLEPGWSEYLIGKADRLALNQAGMNEIVLRHFLGKWFSPHTWKTVPNLIAEYKVSLAQLNPKNVAQFIDSFSGRKISKEFASATFDIFVIVGLDSPHVTNTFESFHLFDATKRSKLEIQNCGDLVCVEDPGHFSKPLDLFLQGIGAPFGTPV